MLVGEGWCVQFGMNGSVSACGVTELVCVCVTLGIIGILSDFSAGESQGSFRIVLAFSVFVLLRFSAEE